EPADLEVLEGLVRVEDLAMLRPVGGHRLGRDPVALPAATPDPAPLPLPEHGIHAVGQPGKAMLRVGLPDPVRTELRELAELRFARGELALHRPHAGDVEHDALEAVDGAVAPANRARDRAHPHGLAVGPQVAVLDLRLAAIAHDPAVQVGPSTLVVAMQADQEALGGGGAVLGIDAEQPEGPGTPLKAV